MGKIPSGGIETDAMLCMVMGNNFPYIGGMAQAMMRIQTHLVRTQIIEENKKSQRNLAIKSLILQRNRRKRKIEGDTGFLHAPVIQRITGRECNISCTYMQL